MPLITYSIDTDEGHSDKCCGSGKRCAGENNLALLREVTEAAREVKRNARHPASCAWSSGGCSCGLWGLVAALARLDTEEGR